MQKYTAFTLVELVVVMAIIAVMSGLGIQALVLFRQTIQFQQTENDIITLMTDIRNQARNSVASAKDVEAGASLIDALQDLDGYAIHFDNNNYSIRTCDADEDAFGNPIADCTDLERADVKPSTLGEVEIYPLDPSNCSIIYFERLTANIMALATLSDNLRDTGTCEFRIQHGNNSALQRDIIVDLENNVSDVFN